MYASNCYYTWVHMIFMAFVFIYVYPPKHSGAGITLSGSRWVSHRDSLQQIWNDTGCACLLINQRRLYNDYPMCSMTFGTRWEVVFLWEEINVKRDKVYSLVGYIYDTLVGCIYDTLYINSLRPSTYRHFQTYLNT